ncbi:MAG: hypothetical protein DRP08_06925, partial [Candidatus Aenigmatarchaeota archaeon]
QRALRGEYAAVIFYTHAPAAYKGKMQQRLEKVLDDIEEDEEHHIEELNLLLSGFNVVPQSVPNDIPLQAVNSWNEVIKAVLELEQTAIEDYLNILKICETNEVFAPIKVKAEEILMEEQEHFNTIQQLLTSEEEKMVELMDKREEERKMSTLILQLLKIADTADTEGRVEVANKIDATLKRMAATRRQIEDVAMAAILAAETQDPNVIEVVHAVVDRLSPYEIMEVARDIFDQVQYRVYETDLDLDTEVKKLGARLVDIGLKKLARALRAFEEYKYINVLEDGKTVVEEAQELINPETPEEAFKEAIKYDAFEEAKEIAEKNNFSAEKQQKLIEEVLATKSAMTIEQLLKLANKLDRAGMFKQADMVTNLLCKAQKADWEKYEEPAKYLSEAEKIIQPKAEDVVEEAERLLSVKEQFKRALIDERFEEAQELAKELTDEERQEAIDEVYGKTAAFVRDLLKVAAKIKDKNVKIAQELENIVVVLVPKELEEDIKDLLKNLETEEDKKMVKFGPDEATEDEEEKNDEKEVVVVPEPGYGRGFGRGFGPGYGRGLRQRLGPRGYPGLGPFCPLRTEDVREIVDIANQLDEIGLSKEADELDQLLREAAKKKKKKEPNIPEKVKEIADAIKRDHPKISDEVKMRMAWETYCSYVNPGYEGCTEKGKSMRKSPKPYR